jgi:hypothetical protein
MIKLNDIINEYLKFMKINDVTIQGVFMGEKITEYSDASGAKSKKRYALIYQKGNDVLIPVQVGLTDVFEEGESYKIQCNINSYNFKGQSGVTIKAA